MKMLVQRRFWLQLLGFAMLAVSCCFAESSLSAPPAANPTEAAVPLSNPYDQQLTNVVREWSAASQPGKVVLLEKMLRLREMVSDPGRVGDELSRVAKDGKESPLVRDEANWRLAEVAQSEGRLNDAGQFANNLGFVGDWYQMGSGACTATALNDIAHRKPLKTTPLKTVLVHGVSDAYSWREDTVCIATSVYSDTNQSVALRFGAAEPAWLYLNGTLEARSDRRTEAEFDQQSVGVQLKAGWNVIALKLGGRSAERRFAFRVTRLGGGGVLLTVDPTRVNGTMWNSDGPVTTDLLDEARRLAESGRAEALDDLADLTSIRGLKGSLAIRKSAVSVVPSAERWAVVADACPDASCRLLALKSALAIDPHDADAANELAKYYSRAGESARALEVLRTALTLHDDDYFLRAQLAQTERAAGLNVESTREYAALDKVPFKSIWLRRELGLYYEEAGDADRAAELLNEAWKLSFDDARVRQALERVARASGDTAALEMLAKAAQALNPSTSVTSVETSRAERFEGAHLRLASLAIDGDSDRGYMENAAQLAANAQRRRPQDDGNVITLADVTVERMLPSEQTVRHVQQVFYIANDRGARDYRTRNISYGESAQISVLHARIYKKEGRVVDGIESDGDGSNDDPSNWMYYDTRSCTLRFPSLQKGDVLEVEYRISPKSEANPFGRYFGELIALQDGLPQQLRRYVLIAPSSRRLNIDAERMPAAQVSTAGGYTIYQWELRNVAPLSNEPRGPSLTEVAPYVTVSTTANWQDFGRWYAEMIAPQFELNTELRTRVAHIMAEKADEVDRIRAIHEFVLHNTNYVAMEFGVYSYKPYPVSQVYERHFGDCKDKASLMIAMMRAAGIDAELALVRTRKMGDVSEHATTLSVFDHAVAYVPKYDLWLDGTAQYAGFHELPLDDQGAMAVTVDLDGTATLRRIPVTLPMQNYTHRVVKAELQSDGKIVFNGSAYTRGEDAPGLRKEYNIAERQRDTMRANLAQVYPSVQVDSVHVDGAHDLEHDVIVSFSGSLNTFAGQKSIELVPSWMPHKYVNSLAPLETRSQELQLPAPWTTDEELHFTLPNGASLEKMPTSWKYDTQYGTALIRYERHGSELVVSTSVQFRKLRIPAAEYFGFRLFCQKVEDAFHQEIKVDLPN